MWMLTPTLSVSEVTLRLGVAMLCGLALGIDREYRDKPAGFRTHGLMALATSLFALFALELLVPQGVPGSSDPLRTVQAMAPSIGFLAAGVVIQSRGSAHGLTTALTLFLAGSIGMVCGGGYYLLAGITTIATIFILTALLWVEKKLFSRKRSPAAMEDPS